MKKIFFAGACLVALAAAPAGAQTGGPDVVVVNFSYGRTVSTVKAIITRGAGKSEVVEIKTGSSDAKKITATEGYYQLIAKLYQEGYAIRSTFTPNINAGATLVFVKDQ